MWHFSIAIGICVSATIVGAAESPIVSERTKQRIGGSKVVEAIQAIRSAEAFRVSSIDPDKSLTEEAVAGRVIEGAATPVEKVLVDKLIVALLADETYFSQDSKGTAKNCGVAFRAKTEDGARVEVSFCLQKGNVYLRVIDPAGKVLKYGDCGGFRNAPQALFRSLSAEVFPKDAAVQKFKPKAAAAESP